MARPKLEVNHVWILEEVVPYEGSEIIGVAIDPEVLKADRTGWWQTPEGDWSTAPKVDRFETFFLLTKHQIRTH